MQYDEDLQTIKSNTADFVGGLFAFVTLLNRFLPLIEKIFNKGKKNVTKKVQNDNN